jgi:hypothetical protein
MTVAVVCRGTQGSVNALVVDSGVGAIGAQTTYDCAHDKLSLVYGNTYMTIVGDALMADVVRSLVAWYEPRRPNLRDPATFAAILGGVERLRAIQVKNHQPVATGLLGTHLLICSRTDVFSWRSDFDERSWKFSRPTAPTEVPPGQGLVMWGHNTLVPYETFGNGGAEPCERMIDAMFDVNDQVEKLGFKLPYPLTRRCSGVVLPHKPSSPLRRVRPFDSLPEQWVKFRGRDALELLQDASFMEFPDLATS